MRSRSLTVLGTGLGLALILSSCAYHTQTTSGSQYLARYAGKEKAPAAAASSGAASGTAVAAPAAIADSEILAAADVEPTLTFPARIGIARIDHGQLSPLPAEEAAAWREMSERLGPAWGQFLPVSPLIAALAGPLAGETACRSHFDCLRETVRTIRLGAARQHLDVVLIYESFGKSQDRSNPLAITKLALIGFFFPTEDVEAEGLAQAVLVDVRNGYHYGTATAAAEKPAHTITTSGNVGAAHAEVQGRARLAAVGALTREVEKMAVELRRDLEARNLPKLYQQ
ncbi:MAG: hypothetical protein MI785_11610 [Kiloniellales bacterium]|nr:hypothetical protein [Kiloniellales bacterium]